MISSTAADWAFVGSPLAFFAGGATAASACSKTVGPTVYGTYMTHHLHATVRNPNIESELAEASAHRTSLLQASAVPIG